MDTSSSRPRVAVVFGGRSSEHAISCISAGSVVGAIDRERYDVVLVGITGEGRWVLESDAPGRLALGPAGELPSVSTSAPTVTLAQGGDRSLVVHDPGAVPRVLGDVDVVFPVMHGPWGQDGTLQGLLDLAGVRYVGAGVLASAVGTDKHFMKTLLRAQGIPVQRWVTVRRAEWERDRGTVRESVASLGYPVFVKPARAGSSFGISRVADASDLDAAIEEAQHHDPKVIVESSAEGARELEIGVLQGRDGGTPECSKLAEVRVDAGHGFYDFEAKYLSDQTTSLDVPADVSEEVAEQARELAARVFAATDCEGLARVDFFLMPDGRLVVNELETMPGFTATSMFPRVWQASGVDYPALVDRLLQLALARDTGLR